MAHRIGAAARPPIAIATWLSTSALMWLPALLAVALLPLFIVIGMSPVATEATPHAPASEVAPATVPAFETVPAATQGIDDAPHIEYHG